MHLQLQIIISLLSNQTRRNGTKSSVWPLVIVLTDKVAGNGWEAVWSFKTWDRIFGRYGVPSESFGTFKYWIQSADL